MEQRAIEDSGFIHLHVNTLTDISIQSDVQTRHLESIPENTQYFRVKE